MLTYDPILMLWRDRKMARKHDPAPLPLTSQHQRDDADIEMWTRSLWGSIFVLTMLNGQTLHIRGQESARRLIRQHKRGSISSVYLKMLVDMVAMVRLSSREQGPPSRMRETSWKSWPRLSSVARDKCIGTFKTPRLLACGRKCPHHTQHFIIAVMERDRL